MDFAQFMKQNGIDIEIVNADSRQLYRYMNIGTAKISQEEMVSIPHHLLDVLDPKDEVSAAWYKHEALRSIAEISVRGNIPILVGGSMLYISAVIDDLVFVEKPDPALRLQLSAEYDADGGAALYRQLQRLDPEGAVSIDPRNKRYLIRALEVCLVTGTSLHQAKRKSHSSFDLQLIGVSRPHEELHKRIVQRTNAMFEQGWVEEVDGLLRKGYSSDDPGMMSHGYRQIAEALTSHSVAEVRNDSSLREIIAAQTRQYAKRQMTWWKRDQRIQWIEP